MSDFNKICGNTPLIKVSSQLYAKLETYNPTGSVKDRMISYVVAKAIVNNEIGTDTVLVEATSGAVELAKEHLKEHNYSYTVFEVPSYLQKMSFA